jgi:hypothetical protein
MDNFWKNKKITAYIALKHHSRFIVPIMEKLAGMGAKIHYLVAQAERSQEITAIETGLDYSHIFEFLKKSDNDEINRIYLDLRDTFASTLVKDIAFTLQVQTVLDKTLFTTAQEYVAFRNYFETDRPDLCIALHEVNRWGKIFAFHAKRSGVPFITLQEGLLTAASANLNFQMTGHVQYSTLCFVWGENSRKKLVSFEAPEQRVIPVGNTHLSDEIKKLVKNNVRKKQRKKYKCRDKFVVLLLFSSDLPPLDEMQPLFNVFQDNPDIMLFTKFHPATTRLKIDTWLKPLNENFKNNIHPVHGEESTYDLMAASDLCVLSEGSTTGLEALAIGKPLVLLKLRAPVIYRSDLAEKKAALSMSPSELADAIKKRADFNAMMDKDHVVQYIKDELYKTDGSIGYATTIMKSALSANLSSDPAPLAAADKASTDWSIIIPVSDSPENFLELLEKTAVNSSEKNFEVILIKQNSVDPGIQQIIDSLEGDISIIQAQEESCLPELMNQAATTANGRYLIFMDSDLAPENDWLSSLEKGFSTFKNAKIFGARIVNRFNNIIHAGMVVNANCQPVSAYIHLDGQFPHALKPRPFQMLDRFICIEKKFFLGMGGFEIQSGRYMFCDLCLRCLHADTYPESIMYLPDVKLLCLYDKPQSTHHEDSIFFYSKWHKFLWESESRLLKTDGVSSLQLDAARMTRAMEIAPPAG